MNNRDTDLPMILNAFRTMVHALSTGSRNSEKRVGLTGAQLFVLEKLRDIEGMTVNELADATHTHQSTVSVVVSRLVNKGLVLRERSKLDRRVQMLSITERGAQKLRTAPETVQDKLVSALKTLPKKERTRLAKNLDAVVEKAGLTNLKPELFLEHRSHDRRK